MMFRDYEKYKKDFCQESSKADFQHFLQRKQTGKVTHDSNITHGLNHHHKVLAYKEKELNQRALALDAFSQQRSVHSELHKQHGLNSTMSNNSRFRHAPSDFDLRKSPRKFTAISNYNKIMKDSRVFMPDGRMRVIRTNIHP